MHPVMTRVPGVVRARAVKVVEMVPAVKMAAKGIQKEKLEAMVIVMAVIAVARRGATRKPDKPVASLQEDPSTEAGVPVRAVTIVISQRTSRMAMMMMWLHASYAKLPRKKLIPS